jgi:hypothetical protein
MKEQILAVAFVNSYCFDVVKVDLTTSLHS